jgi:hypothetical protein
VTESQGFSLGFYLFVWVNNALHLVWEILEGKYGKPTAASVILKILFFFLKMPVAIYFYKS